MVWIAHTNDSAILMKLSVVIVSYRMLRSRFTLEIQPSQMQHNSMGDNKVVYLCTKTYMHLVLIIRNCQKKIIKISVSLTFWKYRPLGAMEKHNRSPK